MSYKSRKIQVYESEEGYDKYACEYDKSLKFLDTFEQGYFEWLNLDLTEKKALEVGCGTGRNTVRLAEHCKNITALDVSGKMLEAIKQKLPKIKTVQGDVEKLLFKDDSFEVIFCHMVLVHLKDPTQALDECYRVLKNDGILFLTILHQKESALLKAGKEGFKIKSYYHSADKIREILENLSYKIKEERPIIEKENRISTIFFCEK